MLAEPDVTPPTYVCTVCSTPVFQGDLPMPCPGCGTMLPTECE